jgi:hypothetical protein
VIWECDLDKDVDRLIDTLARARSADQASKVLGVRPTGASQSASCALESTASVRVQVDLTTLL